MNLLSASAALLLALAPQDGQDGKKQPPRRPQRDPDKPKEKYVPAVPLPDDYVRFVRVPEGGHEPRVALRGEHAPALLFARGEGAAVDLYLTRTSDDGATFAPAVRVNPEAGSVASVEGRHSGTLELGPDGRAHVTWIQAGATPTIVYTRENEEGGFEPPLELGSPAELSSNAAVAVARSGEVFLFYGAREEVAPEGEPVRRIYMRKRAGSGAFSDPVPIGARKHDVSPGSTIDAHVDEAMDYLYVLYRCSYDVKEGDDSTSRDMRLLASENGGLEFKPSMVNSWKRKSDPRTFGSLVQHADTTVACWEGEGLVYWAAIRRQLGKIEVPSSPRDEEQLLWRSSAAAAVSGSNVLVAWLERPRDDRKAAPRLGWQVWLKEGRVPAGSGHAEELPSPHPPAVLPRKAGGFTVLY